jgi:hypothetical protein
MNAKEATEKVIVALTVVVKKGFEKSSKSLVAVAKECHCPRELP